jgi:uncharacterized membrane protein
MTKAEFLTQLQAALSSLPKQEVEHSLSFYAEMIDDRIEDGMSEQEAVAQLDSIDQIAAQIIAEAPFVSRTVAKAKSKGSNLVLIIILLVVLSPIWLSLGLSLFFTALGILISIWAVIISFWAAVLALGVTGVAGLVALIYLIFTGHPVSGVLAAGGGLICIGLAIFAFFGVLALTKAFAKFNVFMVLKLKSLFVRQGSKEAADE